MIKNLIGKIKNLIGLLDENFKRKMVYAFDFAMLGMGIFMIFLGSVISSNGGETKDTRVTIGSFLVFLWYITFPVISREKKEKILNKMVMHYVLIVFLCFIVLFQLKYLLGNLEEGTLSGDIWFSIAGILVLTYLLYIFVSFVQIFYRMSKKIVNFLFPKLENEVSGIKNVIEGVTAFLISITTLGGSILSLVNLIKQLVK